MNVSSDTGFYVKYPDCVRIVQAYSDQNESLHILCSHEAAVGLLITYFSNQKPTKLSKFSTNEDTLNRMIKEKFLLVNIALPSNSDLTTTNKSHLAQSILKLESQIQSQNVIVVLEQRRIRLFGLVDIVKEIEREIEEIKVKHISNEVELDLELKQVKMKQFFFEEEKKYLLCLDKFFVACLLRRAEKL